MCKTQLEQWAEVTDFLTKFHIHFNVISLIFKSILYSIWINTVVHLRQIFMKNLGAQETGKKNVFIVTQYFIFISSYP